MRIRKTHCVHGHERLPSTLKKSGACKLCIKDAYLKGIGGRYKRDRTHCKNGHLLEPERLGKKNRCLVCSRERSKLWVLNHPESSSLHRKRYFDANKQAILDRGKRYRIEQPDTVASTKLLMRYGITFAERNEALEQQDGRCGICGIVLDSATKKTKPFVDHDHTSGIVRGILCQGCNMGLGGFKDNPKSLLRAVEYLNKAR